MDTSKFVPCPDCGQARTGEGCPGCKRIAQLHLTHYKSALLRDNCDQCRLVLALDTQRTRAEKAKARVRELEGAIEHHRAEVENLNDSRLSTESYLAGLYEADEELWATLEGGEESVNCCVTSPPLLEEKDGTPD